jgi:hypothetical protein
LRGRPDAPSFSDGTGHVIGHWRTDLPAAGQAGVLPYVYVTNLDDPPANWHSLTSSARPWSSSPVSTADSWPCRSSSAR